ncbi:aminopeptidase [Candidatus Woesearchaeota archaeon]|nr:aminopeptidase [Candidatus Woesearchaeota archaeon]
MDPRVERLAKIVVGHSCKVKRGDTVLISGSEDAIPLIKAIYKEVLLAGGLPRSNVIFNGRSYIYYKHADMKQINNFPQIDYYEVRNTDCIIYIRSGNNKKELSNVDEKKLAARARVLHKIGTYRVNNTRWCLVPYPTTAYAQDADMSLDEFEDYVYRACNVDYAAMTRKWQKLKQIMDRGDEVRITGLETNLTFSIKGRVAIANMGEYNVPDGEVFTAPVENTANGEILFDYPAIYNNKEVDMVRLKFRDGKCIKATAAKNEGYLNSVLNTDKGARYLGELGIGVNFNIDRFIKDILFDEKIGGTVHLALGQSYKWCKGKNDSAVHWDMIKDLRKDGKVTIDGRTILQNGKFRI